MQSPAIFIDVFDNDNNADNHGSPTAELCEADDDWIDDMVLDVSTNRVVSKLDYTTAAGGELSVLGHTDIDMLSQEILNEISLVGMIVQFNALPDEYSPVINCKQYSNLTTLD